MDKKPGHILIAQTKNGTPPEVQLYDNILECVFQCDGEYSYAVSTENGNIVLKGEFLNGFRLNISDLNSGFYQLVLFNELNRHIYSFRVE